MTWVYMVACTDDYGLVQATRQYFPTEKAAQAYANTVAPSRKPVLVQMDRRTINPEYVKE